MDKRIAKALAAGTVMALPLLTACGASTAPTISSPAPGAPSAAAPSSAAATPSPSATPVDETKDVQAASATFVTTLFTLDSSDSYADYRDRLKPLLSKDAYSDFDSGHFEKSLPAFAKRYGKQARSTTKVSAAPKVEKLTADKATVRVSFVNRIQQRRDGKWHTVRTSTEDNTKVPLVKQDGRWLVENLD
jgi:hypothetical protein